MSSGFTSDLLTGYARFLAASGIGTWKPTCAYTAAETGIVLGTIPQTPDRVITLTAYGVSDNPTLSDSIVGLQVRCRWGGQDPRPVEDLADSIFNLLHGSQHLVLATGVHVVQCVRQSGPVSLGQDANQRWSNSSNFYVTVHRPSPNRL